MIGRYRLTRSPEQLSGLALVGVYASFLIAVHYVHDISAEESSAVLLSQRSKITDSAVLSTSTLFPAPPNFRAPPDYLAPFPPFPPAIPNVQIPPINSAEDVCKVCTSTAYSASCYGTYAVKCLTALKIFRKEVLGIPDQLCSCYNSVANLLIDFCPGIRTSVSYLGNCDPFCYYGVPCPFNPVLYSVLSPKYTALSISKSIRTNRLRVPRPTDPKPAKFGSAAVIITLRVKKNAPDQICFRFVKSRALYRPRSLFIKRGIMGQLGPVVVTFFTGGNLPFRGRGCLVAPPGLLHQLSNNSTQFYVESVATEGSIRGQLVLTPHLITVATSQAANAPCPGKLCMAVADLGLSHYSISYRFHYVKSVRFVRAANIGMVSRGGYPPVIQVVNFFGPLIANVSQANAITPPTDTILTILSDPSAYYMNITTLASPRGALRGQFFDSQQIFAALYGYQVKPNPSGVSGTGIFLAHIGAGGICYEFKFQNVPILPQYAYLHKATVLQAGQITLFTTLSVTRGVTCLEADPDVTASILSNPFEYYVQVYSDNFPTTKLLRGQIYVTPVVGFET